MTHIVRNTRFSWISSIAIGLAAAVVIASLVTHTVSVHRDDGIAHGPYSAPLQDAVQPSWLAPVVRQRMQSLGLEKPESAAYLKTYWNRASAERMFPPPPMNRGDEVVYLVELRFPHKKEAMATGEFEPPVEAIATFGINARSHEVFASAMGMTEVFFDGQDWQDFSLR